jgi:hypothetical protein
MLVQFGPWKTGTIPCGGGVVGNGVGAGKRRRNDIHGQLPKVSLMYGGKSSVDNELSLNRKQKRQQRRNKHLAGFNPMLCVTRPHNISVVGTNTMSQKLEQALDVAPGEIMSWPAAPGPAHSFLSSQNNGVNVASVQAVATSDGQWIVALQNKNATLVLRRQVVGSSPDQSDGGIVQSIAFPKNKYGTSLFILDEPEEVTGATSSDSRIIAGTMDDGSLFYVTLSLLDVDVGDSAKLHVIHSTTISREHNSSAEMKGQQKNKRRGRPQTGKKSSSKEKKTLAEYFLNAMELPGNGVTRKLVITSTHAKASKAEQSPVQFITRQYTITSSGEGGTCDQSELSVLPQNVRQVHSVSTLDGAKGTAAVLCQVASSNESKTGTYAVYSLNLKNISLDSKSALPLYLPWETHSETVHMGGVSRHHVAVTSPTLGLRVYDLRFESGAMVFHCSKLQDIFPNAVDDQHFPIIMDCNSSQNSLVLGLLKTGNIVEIEMAHSTLNLESTCKVTMADSLASSLAASRAKFEHRSKAKSKDSRDKKVASIEQLWEASNMKHVLDSNVYDTHECTNHIKILQAFAEAPTQSNKSWGHAFEATVNTFLGLSHSLKMHDDDSSSSSPVSPADLVHESALVAKKKKKQQNKKGGKGTTIIASQRNGITKNLKEKKAQNDVAVTVINGGPRLVPAARQPNEYQSSLDRLPEEFITCAAECSIRVLVTEYLAQRQRKHTKSRTGKNARNLSKNNSIEALQTLLFCCSVGNLSLRDMNELVASLTKFECTSILEFLCRRSSEHPLHLHTIICILRTCSEVAEQDLVLVACHLLCTVPFDDIRCCFAAFDTDVDATEGYRPHIFSLDEHVLGWYAMQSEDGLLQSLSELSRSYGATKTSTDNRQKLQHKIVRRSSLFWVRLIVAKCEDGINPNLLRGAITKLAIQTTHKPLQGTSSDLGNGAMKVLSLSFASFAEAMAAGILPAPRNETRPNRSSLLVSIEWMEALIDCYQLQTLRMRGHLSETANEDVKDNHTALLAMRQTVKNVMCFCQELLSVESLVSLTVQEFATIAKRKHEAASATDVLYAEDPLTQYKRQRVLEKATVPPYSVERLQF